MSARLVLAAAALLLAGPGCLREPNVCDGPGNLVCPHDTACSSAGTCLVLPDACAEFADGDLCGDGNSICLAGACVVSVCGDGFTDKHHGEACDSGAANSDLEPGACRTTCQLASCGDGVLDPHEAPWCLGVRDQVDAPSQDLRLQRADLDGDGQPDVVASYLDGSEVVLVWWRIGADGHFGAPETLARLPAVTASAPPALLAADLDGDGRIDLALADHDAAGDARVQLFTRASGAWSATVVLDVPGFDVVGLAAGDIDRDGHLDLLVASRVGYIADGYLVVYRGGAAALPAVASTIVPVAQPFGLEAGDFDGDGFVDAAVVSGQDVIEAVRLYWGGAGGFTADDNQLVTKMEPLVDDVVASEAPDLVYAVDGAVVLAHGTASPHVLQDAGFSAGVRAVAVLDVDDNTWPDVAVLDASGLTIYAEPKNVARHVDIGFLPTALSSSPARRDELVVLGVSDNQPRLALLRGGDGLLAGARPAFNPDLSPVDEVYLVDMDLNGAPDLVLETSPVHYDPDPALQHHRGPDGSVFHSGPMAFFGPPLGMASGDLDGDGHADLVGLDQRTSPDKTAVHTALTTHGSLLQGPAVQDDAPVIADTAKIVDVDGDGKNDVLLVDAKTGLVSWLGNPAGDGVLAPVLAAGSLGGASLPLRSVQVVDLDGDGHLEAIALDAASTLMVWRGGDAPGWSGTPLTRPGVVHVSVAARDAHASVLALASLDGAVDVVALEAAGLVGKWHGEGHAFDAALADLDGDGLLDLVTLGEQLEVRRHLPGAAFDFHPPEEYVVPPAGRGLRHLRLGDVDADGAPDVLLFDDASIDWFHTRRSR